MSIIVNIIVNTNAPAPAPARPQPETDTSESTVDYTLIYTYSILYVLYIYIYICYYIVRSCGFRPGRGNTHTFQWRVPMDLQREFQRIAHCSIACSKGLSLCQRIFTRVVRWIFTAILWTVRARSVLAASCNYSITKQHMIK